MHAKNLLEAAPSLTSVQKVSDRLESELSAYCVKSSTLAAAMADDQELPPGNTEVEAILALWKRKKHEKLHIRYVAAGSNVDEWVEFKPINGPEHCRAIFRRIKHLAEECRKHVVERFESKKVWAHIGIFDLEFAYAPGPFQNAVWEIGSYLNLETEPLIEEMRIAFSIRTVLLKEGKFKTAESLWLATLKDLKSQDRCFLAQKMISAFLLAPSQAATCERAFADATQLQKTLGKDTSTQTLHDYMIVSSAGPSPEQAAADGFLAKCTNKFMEKERRVANMMNHDTRKRGRAVLQRKRKPRSDIGSKRPNYKRRRIHAGLRAQPTARLLTRECGEVLEMAEAPEGVAWNTHGIFEPLEERKTGKDVPSDSDWCGEKGACALAVVSFNHCKQRSRLHTKYMIDLCTGLPTAMHYFSWRWGRPLG